MQFNFWPAAEFIVTMCGCKMRMIALIYAFMSNFLESNRSTWSVSSTGYRNRGNRRSCLFVLVFCILRLFRLGICVCITPSRFLLLVVYLHRSRLVLRIRFPSLSIRPEVLD